MRKYLLTTVMALMAMTTVNAQTIKIYEYDDNGNLLSTPLFTTNKKVKIVVEQRVDDFQSQNLVSGAKVEGKVIVNGDTITKQVGGTVPEYVDLGMRDAKKRKILWATHNIGATTPEEYGAYVVYAEVGSAEDGYVNGVKDPISNYSTLTTKYMNPKNGLLLKYCDSTYKGDGAFMDSKNTLEEADDVATVNLGEGCRLPNRAELLSLTMTKYFTWTREGNGYRITSKKAGFEGNSIFLPMAGYIDGTKVVDKDAVGYYMSCTQAIGEEFCVKFGTEIKPTLDTLARHLGLALRAVRIE